MEEAASVLATWMARLRAQGQRGHSGVGTVSMGRCRAIWRKLGERVLCPRKELLGAGPVPEGQ